MTDHNFDQFYKESINGRNGNVFTRLAALEKAIARLQTRNITNFVTQVINSNQQIIMPSILGGESDPTSINFSGVIISPNGVLLNDGITYSFAIVENGVVVQGVANNQETEPIPVVYDHGMEWQNVFVSEEFVSSATFATDGDFTVGELGWQSINGTTTAQMLGIATFGDVHKHYGIVSLANDVGFEGYLRLNNTYIPTIKLMQFVAGFEATANTGDGYAFGLGNEGIGFATDDSMQGVYFQREHGDGNWHAISRDDFGITDTDTGVTFAGDTWYLFEIKQDVTGTIKYYINQALVATHTTNVDTLDAFDVAPVFGLKGTTTLHAYFDYFAMQISGMSSRHDVIVPSPSMSPSASMSPSSSASASQSPSASVSPS